MRQHDLAGPQAGGNGRSSTVPAHDDAAVSRLPLQPHVSTRKGSAVSATDRPPEVPKNLWEQLTPEIRGMISRAARQGRFRYAQSMDELHAADLARFGIGAPDGKTIPILQPLPDGREICEGTYSLNGNGTCYNPADVDLEQYPKCKDAGYMRKRDGTAARTGSGDSDLPTYEEEYGKPFAEQDRKRFLELMESERLWMITQYEGPASAGVGMVVIAPERYLHLLRDSAKVQGAVSLSELDESFRVRGIWVCCPAARHVLHQGLQRTVWELPEVKDDVDAMAPVVGYVNNCYFGHRKKTGFGVLLFWASLLGFRVWHVSQVLIRRIRDNPLDERQFLRLARAARSADTDSEREEVIRELANLFVGLVQIGPSGVGKSELARRILFLLSEIVAGHNGTVDYPDGFDPKQSAADRYLVVGRDAVDDHLDVMPADRHEDYLLLQAGDDIGIELMWMETPQGVVAFIDVEDEWFIRLDFMNEEGEDPEMEVVSAGGGTMCSYMNAVHPGEGDPQLKPYLTHAGCDNRRLTPSKDLLPNVHIGVTPVNAMLVGQALPHTGPKEWNQGKANPSVVGACHILDPVLALAHLSVMVRANKNPSANAIGLELLFNEGGASQRPFDPRFAEAQINELVDFSLQHPDWPRILHSAKGCGRKLTAYSFSEMLKKLAACRGGLSFEPEELVPANHYWVTDDADPGERPSLTLLGDIPISFKYGELELFPWYLWVYHPKNLGQDLFRYAYQEYRLFFEKNLRALLTPRLRKEAHQWITAVLDEAPKEQRRALLG